MFHVPKADNDCPRVKAKRKQRNRMIRKRNEPIMYGLHTSASLFIISPITSAYWCGYSSPTATVLHQSPRPKKTVIGKNDDGEKSSKNNRKSPHSPDAVNPDNRQDDEQSMTNRPDRDKKSRQKKNEEFYYEEQSECMHKNKS